jgi:hypothetical protein
MPSIPINLVPVNTSGDGVNSMDTTPPNSAPLVVEFSSPFYLHHGDSPRTLLVSQPLVGNNYHTSKRSMSMTFSAKNKLGFIDGSLEKSAATILNPLHGRIIWSSHGF